MMCIVEPVDFLDVVLAPLTEGDWFDEQVLETLVIGVAKHVSGLLGHKFRVQEVAYEFPIN